MTIPGNESAFADAFNLLCEDFIARGTYREVFSCRLNPAWVVKVEIDKGDWRSFANFQEWHFWDWNREYRKVSDWLAPCHFLSPDGRILTDLKPSNFGWLDGKFVCIDYATTLDNPDIKLKKAAWR